MISIIMSTCAPALTPPSLTSAKEPRPWCVTTCAFAGDHDMNLPLRKALRSRAHASPSTGVRWTGVGRVKVC